MFHPVKRLDGYTFRDIPYAAGETFPAGALVLRDANGEIAECGVDPALIAGVATAAVADYAWKADTFNTVAPSVPIATADQEFRGTMVGIWAAANLGASYGVTANAVTGEWEIDQAKVAAADLRVQIVGVDDDVAVGDVNPQVRFVILTANRQVIT
jgi:hypothetical protein